MSSNRRAAAYDVGREAIFAGGFIGVVWFGAYLYELGFLARFGVPPTLADVGFPKSLTVAFVLGSLGALVGSLGLMLAGLVEGDLRAPFLAAAAAGTLLLGAYGLGLEGWAVPLLMSGTPEIMPLWLRVLLAGCVIVVAAQVASGWLDRMAEGEAPRVCRGALIAVLLMLVPAWFGWMGAERKAEARTTFLYLVDDPDYVLIRIYDDHAIFVRYDRSSRTFRDDYRAVPLGGAGEAFVSFRPAPRS
ncbi:MAG: hypothetical protein ACK4QW_08135 [Alphaproteobacteria bacterium]